MQYLDRAGDGRSGDRRFVASSGAGPVIISDQAAPLQFEPAGGSQGEFLDLLKYWRILLKHRYIVIGAVVIALALGVAATLMMTPIYTATTTVQIDRETAKVVNVEGMDPASERLMAGEEFFQTQYGLLKSRSLAERVVDSLGLARNDEFLKAMGEGDGFSLLSGPSRPRTVETRRRIATNLLIENLEVNPVRGSRLVRVSFSSPDAKLSEKVVNAIAANFITSNLDRRFESTAYARDFVQRRLEQAKQRLEESEKQLTAYAENQQIINIAEPSRTAEGTGATQSLTTASLVALNSSLASASSERIRAEQRWRQAQSTPGLGLSDVLVSPTIQALSKSRSELAARYQEQLSVYKPEFPAMRQLQAQIGELDRQIDGEAGNVRQALKNQYLVALNQEQALQQKVAGLKTSVLDLQNRSIQYNILQREVDTNRTLYDGLLQRFKELGVAGGLQTNNISVVDRAEVPLKPSKPQPLRNLLIALIAGVVVGVALALAIEFLDEALNSPEQVEEKLGLTMLGTVPKLESGTTPMGALGDVRSAFSEAYYSIRTALQFSTADGAPRSIFVTSARPSEGKSTSSLAIARGFAQLGLKVLLIDADMRKPSLHRVTAMSNQAGLSNYLTGTASLASVVQVTDVPHLSIVTSGPLPPNPAELVAGLRVAALIQDALANFDMVVIDGPPVMSLSDAPQLSSHAAATVLVIEAGGTRRNVAALALKRLRAARARVVGALLTKFDATKAAYGASYAYSYSYNYGRELPAQRQG